MTIETLKLLHLNPPVCAVLHVNVSQGLPTDRGERERRGAHSQGGLLQLALKQCLTQVQID